MLVICVPLNFCLGSATETNRSTSWHSTTYSFGTTQLPAMGQLSMTLFPPLVLTYFCMKYNTFVGRRDMEF